MAFIDMEKAYDRVDRRKLFEVMRGYGVQETLVDVIERIYNGSRIKFEMGSVTTGWCKSDSGVRQGGPSSPLLFNIYMRELGIGHGPNPEKGLFFGVCCNILEAI